jgi:hypothetical protein
VHQLATRFSGEEGQSDVAELEIVRQSAADSRHFFLIFQLVNILPEARLCRKTAAKPEIPVKSPPVSSPGEATGRPAVS